MSEEGVRELNRQFSISFQGITWFTYRNNIEQNLIGSALRSDAGWGCMLRTGQMILFQAIKRHLLTESFKIDMIDEAGIR